MTNPLNSQAKPYFYYYISCYKSSFWLLSCLESGTAVVKRSSSRLELDNTDFLTEKQAPKLCTFPILYNRK